MTTPLPPFARYHMPWVELDAVDDGGDDDTNIFGVSAPTPLASQFTVIALHGFAASAEQFRPRVQTIVRLTPRARYVMPSAPLISISGGGGYQLNAWFDMRLQRHAIRNAIFSPYDAAAEAAKLDYDDNSSHALPWCEDQPSLHAQARQFDELVLRESTRYAAATTSQSRVAMLGYSQGGAMALHYALTRRSAALGAVVVMSGFLPTGRDDQARMLRNIPLGRTCPLDRGNALPPLLWVHGDCDELVSHKRAYRDYTRLHEIFRWTRSRFITVPYQRHQITEQEQTHIATFLNNTFEP